MSVDNAGWYYVDGQLRYKDDDGWTERYRAVESQGATARPLNSEPTDKATDSSSTHPKEPRRRTSSVAIAVAAGLLGFGLGSGLPNGEALDGWVSWATQKVGEISAFITPPPPATPAASLTRK